MQTEITVEYEREQSGMILACAKVNGVPYATCGLTPKEAKQKLVDYITMRTTVGVPSPEKITIEIPVPFLTA